MPDGPTATDLRIRYADGTGRLVVSGSLCALLPADATRRLVDALWRLPSADLVTVARALLEVVDDLPSDFAVAVLHEDSASVLLRGGATAHHVAETYVAEHVQTWRELELPLDGLALSLAGERLDASLPLAGGVVSAHAVAWVADPVAPVEPDPAASPAAAPDTPSESSGATTIIAAVDEPQADAGDDDDLEAPALPHPLSETLRPDEVAPAGAHESIDVADAVSAGDPDPKPGGDHDDSYDRLFGATEHVSRRPAQPEDAPPPSTPGWAPPAWPTPVDVPIASPLGDPTTLPGSAVSEATEGAAVSSGSEAPSHAVISGVPLISAVPGTTPSHSPSAPDVPPARADKVYVPPEPQPAAAPATGHDDDISGLTVSRSSLAALRVGPQVHGVHCPRGHANPVEAVVCRVCGIEVPPQSATTLTRPPLGALVAEEVPPGAPTRIALEGPLLLGRRPTLDGQSGPVPHLVTVASPDNDLSRNHLRVNLDGWHVLITDLGSTNGTVVQLPGEQPERIHPQRPTMITPGTRLTLADVATYVYEVTA